MKLTQDFIQKLTHLNRINTSILLTPGNKLSIKNGDANLATVTLDEAIPTKAAIYEVALFLKALSLFEVEKTNLEFNEDHILIKNDKQKARYNLTEERFIGKSVPTRDLEDILESEDLGEELLKIDFGSEVFGKISDTIRAMALPHLSFKVENSVVKAVVGNKDNKGKNSLEITLAQVDCPDLEYVFETADFMKIPAGDYKLTLFKGVSSFVLTSKVFNVFMSSNVSHTVKP